MKSKTEMVNRLLCEMRREGDVEGLLGAVSSAIILLFINWANRSKGRKTE